MPLNKIGETIRKIRVAKKITIKKMAEKTNLSSSLISQVERNLITPSLPTLVKISKILEIPLVSFFLEDEVISNCVVRKKDRKKLRISPSGIVFQLLSPDINRKIEFLLVEIEGKDGDYEKLVSYHGEKCGYVIKGKLEVKLGDKTYYLEEGDSIYFKSSIPHRFKSADEGKVVSIWAITPPSF